jgi:myo-inositol 2-dehydrogenase / D-chiro-inositol 1-dehydrogenase
MLGKDTAMRLGLIGLGRIGAFHADTLSRLDQVDSLVVTDAVPAMTASVAERFGAESADSPQELISSGVDGIVIAAATDAHTALIRAGVDAGIPVFCEKPLSGVVEEAVAIADYVNKTGVPVQIGYPRRFDPAYLAARNALEAGELGWVHTVRSTTLDPAPPPRGYVAVSGGIFRDCSVHDFDTVRWVTGREVVEVYATGSARGDDFFAELGDVATAQTLLTFGDGATAVVSNTRYNARGHDVRLELHGTVDSVAAGWSQCTPLRNLERDAAWPTGKPWTFFMDRLVDAFRAELTAFTEVVAGKRPTPCSVDDALAVTWIAEAATLSLQQHRPVRIAEVQP